jgi:hypothetical protein
MFLFVLSTSNFTQNRGISPVNGPAANMNIMYKGVKVGSIEWSRRGWVTSFMVKTPNGPVPDIYAIGFGDLHIIKGHLSVNTYRIINYYNRKGGIYGITNQLLKERGKGGKSTVESFE